MFNDKEYKKQHRKDNVEKYRKAQRKYYFGHKEFCLASSKKWRILNPETKEAEINRHLRENYGITSSDYNLLYDKQSGRCAICDKHQSELKRRLDVDHNHITGKIRGLLCHKCNLAIGNVEEKEEILLEIIKYLKRDK